MFRRPSNLWSNFCREHRKIFNRKRFNNNLQEYRELRSPIKDVPPWTQHHHTTDPGSLKGNIRRHPPYLLSPMTDASLEQVHSSRWVIHSIFIAFQQILRVAALPRVIFKFYFENKSMRTWPKKKMSFLSPFSFIYHTSYFAMTSI